MRPGDEQQSSNNAQDPDAHGFLPIIKIQHQDSADEQARKHNQRYPIILPDESLDLQADEIKIHGKYGYLAAPDNKGVDHHKIVVLIEMMKYGLLYIFGLTQMHYNEIASIVAYSPSTQADYQCCYVTCFNSD